MSCHARMHACTTQAESKWLLMHAARRFTEVLATAGLAPPQPSASGPVPSLADGAAPVPPGSRRQSWVAEAAGRRDVSSALRLGVAAASLLLRHVALLQVGRWEDGGEQGQRLGYCFCACGTDTPWPLNSSVPPRSKLCVSQLQEER